ncbi:MAG TPA: GNAT family protein [Streptosporangiaceae bacterium]
MVPTITDGVIVLNGHTDDDIPAHVAGEDEETALRFGWWPQKSTEADVRRAFDSWAREWQHGGPRRTFATREVATSRLVGGCELRLQPDGSAEVSYWTSAGQRRRGFSTRALALLLQYGSSIGVTRFESHVAEDNVASRRVSEHNGFRAAGTFTDTDGTFMIRYQARRRPPPGDGPGPPRTGCPVSEG